MGLGALVISLVAVPGVMAEHKLPRDEAAVQEAMGALEGLGGAFSVHETEHYVLLFNCDESLAIGRGQLLEKLHRGYRAFLNRMRIRHGGLKKKLVVLVFENEVDFAAYARQDEVDLPAGAGFYLQGYYSSATNRAAFFNQRKGGAYERSKREMEEVARQLGEIPGPNDRTISVRGPDGQRQTTKMELARELVRLKKRLIGQFERENLTVTQHEGAHQLAFNTGLQSRDAAYPMWVSEGLACMFETPGTHKGFGAFRVNDERLRDYRDAVKRGATRGMRGLVRAASDERGSPIDLYAESWALFFFLARTMPKELSGYLDALASRERTRAFDPAGEWGLFEEHFAPGENRLGIRWRNFVKALR